ncbi:putative Serine/threonine-protein kinase Nek1 [Paratrimastix pyriformis]|uniref:non-specific serine/threonine protein kinase n=1 Tax=Paratrimastix pyriformis TaxID=342808 RepID=A0ABQ8UTK1_9EUKA|nr:putative Serine/threonine-protein kinase Nek1 [Paratrimastix pyriformis]
MVLQEMFTADFPLPPQYAPAPSSPRSATPSFVARLPVVTYHAGNLPAEKRTCTICLESYEEEEHVTFLPCLHCFHESCIARWLAQNSQCPLCKTDATEEQQERQSCRDDFEILKFLGKGSYGSVSKVLRKRDGREYALKEVNIRYMSQKEREEAVNEIRILACFNHPNIIRYCEAFIEDDKLCIITEYASHGDLLSKIKKRRASRRFFSEETIWSYFIQLCVGLQYLHARNVLHRDIKAANVFLTSGDGVKIGDLGVAKLLKGKDGLARTSIGTPYYLSPEIWQNRPYNNKSDIWSLGCVLYEICTLVRPFDAQSMEGLARRVLSGRFAPLPTTYSSELTNLVASMLALDPKKRPDLTQILVMPAVTRRMHLAPQSPYTPHKPPPSFVLQSTIRVPRAVKGGHIPPAGLHLPPSSYPLESENAHFAATTSSDPEQPGAALRAWVERDTGVTLSEGGSNPLSTPIRPLKGFSAPSAIGGPEGRLPGMPPPRRGADDSDAESDDERNRRLAGGPASRAQPFPSEKPNYPPLPALGGPAAGEWRAPSGPGRGLDAVHYRGVPYGGGGGGVAAALGQGAPSSASNTRMLPLRKGNGYHNPAGANEPPSASRDGMQNPPRLAPPRLSAPAAGAGRPPLPPARFGAMRR